MPHLRLQNETMPQ